MVLSRSCCQDVLAVLCITWSLRACLCNATEAVEEADVYRVCPSSIHSSTADVICASYARPLVAVIIAGSARTFAQPLLYRTIRTNLLEAFGGNITVFALLKILDSRGDKRACCNARIVSSKRAYSVALQHLAGAAENGVHVKIVDHAPKPVCGWRRGFHPSLLGQVMTRKLSWEQLRQFEHRAGVSHDIVIYSRPDVAWLHAIQPYCFWNLNAPTRLWDWVWLFPGKLAEEFFMRPYNEVNRTCGEFGSKTTSGVEGYMYKVLPNFKENFDRLPAVICRANIEGNPEVSDGRRNRYQSRWSWAGLNAISDEITFKNPCANAVEMLNATPLARESPPQLVANCPVFTER